MQYWHIQSVDWFAQLPPPAQVILEQQASVGDYPKGAMIFEPTPRPDKVFVLREGLCRIYSVSTQGEEFTLDFVSPGEVFGELAILGDIPQVHFAVAFEACRVLQLSRTSFMELMQSLPSFSLSVTKQVAGRLVSIQTRAEDLVFRTAASRLARMLLSLEQVYGRDAGAGRCLGIRLTQTEIATLIGTSRPTASLLINGFKTAGVLTHRGGHIILTDLARVRQAAENPEARLPLEDALAMSSS